jgi:3-methyladenine DNA glycosylase AlkC
VADALKTFFDRPLIVRIGDTFRAAWPAFAHEAFVRQASGGLDALELMGRAGHIAAALAATLPADRGRALRVLLRALGPERASTEGQGMEGFFYLPHVLFVAAHGLDHFDEAMEAQYQLTRRFTAEFSLRAYLQRHPERTLRLLARWARDKNPHVRRLVSEGTRPRLPWAPRLRAFEADPTPVIALLELLKDDPEPYVQRSVANNLNDIGKDHPRRLIAICRRWSREAGPGQRPDSSQDRTPAGPAARTPNRPWIIRHGLRSLVKKGDRDALALLGFGSARGWSATGTVSPARLRIGERAAVVITVKNGSRRRAAACVDLVVHFIKASGAARPKVFKGQHVTLEAGASAAFRRTISFAVHTTRTPRPGVHRVDAIVNGAVMPVGTIVVA